MDLFIPPLFRVPDERGTKTRAAVYRKGNASLELNIYQLEMLNNRRKMVDFWAQSIVFSGVKR